MKDIAVYDSTEITSFEQLKEVFKNNWGVKILGVIFLDWHDILDWYDFVTNDDTLLPDLEDLELSRIAELCWNFMEEKYNFKD